MLAPCFLVQDPNVFVEIALYETASRQGDLRVNKVTTLLMEVVKNLKHSLLIALSHHFRPRITKVHGAQAKRGDANASRRCHDAVVLQEGGRFGHITEWRRHGD